MSQRAPSMAGWRAFFARGESNLSPAGDRDATAERARLGPNSLLLRIVGLEQTSDSRSTECWVRVQWPEPRYQGGVLYEDSGLIPVPRAVYDALAAMRERPRLRVTFDLLGPYLADVGPDDTIDVRSEER